MKTTRDIVKQFIKQLNLKLEEMEQGVYIELNGGILELVKENERYFLLVTSDMHEIFTFLMYVGDFISAFVRLKRFGEMDTMKEIQ